MPRAQHCRHRHTPQTAGTGGGLVPIPGVRRAAVAGVVWQWWTASRHQASNASQAACTTPLLPWNSEPSALHWGGSGRGPPVQGGGLAAAGQPNQCRWPGCCVRAVPSYPARPARGAAVQAARRLVCAVACGGRAQTPAVGPGFSAAQRCCRSRSPSRSVAAQATRAALVAWCSTLAVPSRRARVLM